MLRKLDLMVLVLLPVILSHRKNQGSARSEDVLLLQQRRGFKGSPRPYGIDRPTRVEEFNRTDVIHPEYQIPATLQPGNVSKFYYLSPRDGPPLTLLVTPCKGPISWTVSSVGPPDEDHHQSTGARSQTTWPVKTLISGSPLFTYEGEDAQNFTIPKVRAGLYRLEIKSLVENTDLTDKSPNTVLLYVTSSDLDHLPARSSNVIGGKQRHGTLRFQQRRSPRRLTVSWSKSQVDPHLSSYCLAVTSGTSHPKTLCAAENVLKSYPRMNTKGISKEHRSVPEGLHCLHQTRLTLHGLRYNATYNFTLYVVSTRNNVSTRVATEMMKFRRTPAQTLRTGRYVTANLRENDGFINFRYRPQENATTEFHVLPCGDGIVRAKLKGPGIVRKKEVIGHASLTAPSLPPGKRYTLRVSATPQELVRMSKVKVLATQEGSIVYPEVPSRSAPREYRSLKKCNEVTVGVEPAGAAKYCILARELRGSPSSAGIASIPDQCGLHRRRRSEFTFEKCKEITSPPENRALPFTVSKLQPGKTYLVQVTAQLKGQSLSYPLLDVRTRRSCRP
ncbi:protein NDNF [Venturia canescens]|uniref:protein NDNF n=1 Tax=Venturia canescens TaxID=32260 RepID=UPI001C9C8279|nr:protein NDNF-like [Venturia canescens]